MGSGNQTLALRDLYPKVEVKGSAVPLAAVMRMRFRLSSDRAPEFQGTAACRQQGAQWNCSLPATRLDLRIEVQGHVPQHYWSVQPPFRLAERENSLEFLPGASVGAWVDGVLSDPAVDAKLISFDEPKAVDRNFEVTRAGEGAAFLLLGAVAPGRYEVLVTQKGRVGARYQILRVAQGEAVLLPGAIRLDKLSAGLEVSVIPAQSPSGRSWQVQLLFVDSGDGAAEQVGRWDLNGSLSISPLASGKYRVRILDEEDSRWVDEEIDIGEQILPLSFDLGAADLSGTVFLGDEPLPGAELVFRHEGAMLRFHSDESGRFSGRVGKAGTWEIQILSRTPQIDRRVKREIPPRELEIRLADLGIRGVVEHEDGSVAARATVMVARLDGEEESWGSARTDEEGAFDYRGVIAGTYRLSAFKVDDAGAGEVPVEEWADEVAVEVDEKKGGPSDLTLTLRKKAILRGRVLSAVGPVAGARLEFRGAKNPVVGLVESATTDLDGSFEVAMPKSHFPLVVAVFASGYPTVLRLAASGDQSMEILLPSETANVTIEDSQSETKDGVRRQFALIQDGLALLEGPTGGFSRSAGPDSSIGARAQIAPGPFAACSGTAAELHQLLTTGSSPTGVVCAYGNAAPGTTVAVRLPP